MTTPPAFDLGQIREVLRAVDPDRIPSSISRPGSGLTGSIYIIHANTRDLILKVSEGTAATWKPKKEQLIYSLLRDRKIPAPDMIAMDDSRSHFPFAYTLSERLPGSMLSSSYEEMSGEQRIAIYRQLGDYLGRIHSYTFSSYGDVVMQEESITVGPARELEGAASTGPFTSWKEMHRQIVQRHLALFAQTDFEDLIAPLEQWFQAHECLIDYPVQPRLLHMDLHMGNILVHEETVTGIIDVEESLVGHNEYDLMRTELAHFGEGYEAVHTAFLEAYTQHIPLDAGYEERKPFYELSRQLVGIRCLLQYDSRYASDTKGEIQAMRNRVGELLRN